MWYKILGIGFMAVSSWISIYICISIGNWIGTWKLGLAITFPTMLVMIVITGLSLIAFTFITHMIMEKGNK